MLKSPFKFLDSYTKEDLDIFFGREREIEELYHRVFESKLMLVYGVSGTGKSSLIHCGLANKFQETDWLPLVIRRGGNILESMATAVKSSSITPQSTDIQTIPQFKKAVKSLYLDHYKPVFFIFDQFEELFIFGNKEEKKSFIQVIKALYESEAQCRFIFIMREEYMAGFTEFERYIPAIFQNRERIEKMSHSNALEAIKGPCKIAGINVEDGFAEALLEKLSPESADVELTYLQVFLDRILKYSVPSEGKVNFTTSLLSKVGNVSDLLGSFLEEQLNGLDEPDTGISILKTLVSVKGTKKALSVKEVIESCRIFGKEISYELCSEYLQKFVNIRILRDKDTEEKYELRHDSLASKIYEKITLIEKELLEVTQFLENAWSVYIKRAILLNSDDLLYIAPYRNRLFVSKDINNLISYSEKELNKGKKRIKRLAFAGFISILIISASALFAVYGWPFSGLLRNFGNAVYILFFLPFFAYYVIKTRENRTMNLLFLLFTLIFLGYNYLRTNAIKSTLNHVCAGPLIYSDESISRTTELYILKLDSTYNQLDRSSKQIPKFGSDFKKNADNLKIRTDEIVNYIQDLKIKIIQVQEGPGCPALNGRDINVARLTKLDEINVPSEIMIGPNDNGKAFSLKILIQDYLNYLNEITNGESGISENINNALNTEDRMISGTGNQPGHLERWEHYKFQSVSSWFVLITLSQIQSDIRYSEAEVMSFLYNKLIARTDQRQMNKK